jgi:hypothetical protein
MPSTHDPNDAPTHRRWQALDDTQRALAAELAERAERILARSEDGLSFREAVDLAAQQLGLDLRRGAR